MKSGATLSKGRRLAAGKLLIQRRNGENEKEGGCKASGAPHLSVGKRKRRREGLASPTVGENEKEGPSRKGKGEERGEDR